MPDKYYEIPQQNEAPTHHRASAAQTHLDYYGTPSHDDDPIEYDVFAKAVRIA